MKKLFALLLTLALLCLLAPASLAAEGVVITLEPQSSTYPEYAVASYTVRATGSNLRAFWFMEWQGTTYDITDLSTGMQPWEPYAGETYGASQEDANTFVYFFGGIGPELDGAWIWCVVEDGHYDAVSQKARVSVGGNANPPVIFELPARLTVEQGSAAEIRCVATAPGDSQLSFLWYESPNARLEEITALNRGEETGDCLFPDTTQVGTRNYLCMVTSSEGGVTYTSFVPVTVTPKAAPQPTEPATVPPTTAPATTPATTPASAPETTAPSTVPSTVPETAPQTQPAPTPVSDGDDAASTPWLAIILIVVAAIGLGIGTALLLANRKK